MTIEKQCIGAVDLFELDKVEGWACYRGDETPVILELLLNDESLGTFRCDQFRRDLVSVRPDGMLAFSLNLQIKAKNLLVFLPRACKMTIRDSVTKQVLQDGEKHFSGARNDDSHRFANDKDEKFRLNKGTIVVPLSEYSVETKNCLLTLIDEVITVTKGYGNDLVICYGTLLGAARQNDFLPHDDDVDCAFIAKSDDMLSAAKELSGYAEYLKAKGYVVEAKTNGQIHVASSTEYFASLDIFLAWFSNDRLNLTFTVKEGLRRQDVYPLTTVKLAGKSFPACARFDLLLGAIYGSNWRTPDPAFCWARPKEIVAFFLPLHNYNLSANRDYWSAYYKTASLPPFPSQFAIFAMGLGEKFGCFIDIGCGSARDSFFLGRLGIKVIGADYEQGIIEGNNALAKKEGLYPAVSFHHVDFSDLGSSADFIEAIKRHTGNIRFRCFYSRFFFHAIDVNTQAAVFEVLERTMNVGDVFACEYRVESDSTGKKVTSEHYRRYIDPLDFMRHAASYGLDCYYFVEGKGYANYKVDDAHVARMLFRKAETTLA